MTSSRNLAKTLFPLFFAVSAFSGEDSGPIAETNFERNRLEKIGLSMESTYTAEFWANARGGYKTDQTHLHNIDIAASLDTKMAGLWSHGTFTIRLLSNPGGRSLTEEIVGDSQTVSNIEAPHSTRLYELWYEHLLLNKSLSLLFGIHDLNSDFAVSDPASLFINSSFGISKDISGGGRPSIYPLAAPAVRARYSFRDAWEFKLGIYSGDPGDPDTRKHFPKLAFSGDAGAFLDFEAAYRFGRDTAPGAIKAGYWKNTGRFDDVLDVDTAGEPIGHRGNEGFYLIAEKAIPIARTGKSLGAFLQLGSAPDLSINEFTSYVGAGLRFIGFIPRRSSDEAGIAVAHARINDRLVAGFGRDRSETTLEATYRIAIGERIALQPDVQFVFNPAADPARENAVIVGARMKVSF